MADASAAQTPAPESAEQTQQPDDASPAASAAATSKSNKSSNSRRKSVGGGSKLNKKASKAKLLHLDAQPGDHYYVKLKGFPQWPVIICDEDMLPQSLIKSRPVSAMRPDGTYREDFADGGKRAHDRTYPVMYLHTNEFGWVVNTELIELDPEAIKDMKMDKMRKDLAAAHHLAAETHPLSFYKEVLQRFQEELIEQEKARAAKAAATPKGKKSKAAVSEDEDVEMADASDEQPQTDKKKAKKRKAEEPVEETPQRSESVKKPKIKLTTNSTAKTANGAAATPKTAKPAAEAKTTKAKPAKKTKETEEKKGEKEAATPKEQELTPEEKHTRKEREVLFLRHKLQKGLLTRDQEPKSEEMKVMSEFLTKLEAFPDLEVSIIRATKINKVLKAILKLENIPKEEEFKFKPRSQTLLDKWNKLLAGEATSAAVLAADKEATTNGVNGKAKEVEKEVKEDTNKTNGGKGKSEEPSTSDKAEEAPKDKDGDSKMEEAEAKAEEKAEKKDADEKTEKPETEDAKSSETVEAAA
ncbi:hypothetical protein QBC45DRAFT_78409 [Copromyces sp. CBS 386.78]|nr:hypothetical protein QBC45DRAFT_78409 [Copromyces sp. CBS 386.78]